MSLKFATIPQKRLLQGISSSATSFYLDNILSFDGLTDIVPADLGSVHYCAFRNDTGTVLELMEIDPATISSGPITINKRGLSFYGDLTTQDTDLKLDWPANTIVMLGTDVPQIFQWLKEYVDDTAFNGAPDASTTVKGIVEEATDAQIVAGTDTGETGAKLFAPPSKMNTQIQAKIVTDRVRTTTATSSATPTIDTDTYNRLTLTAQAVDITSMTTNLSGTPVDGQKLQVRITPATRTMAFVASSYKEESGSASTIVNKPTGTADNDLMIAVIARSGGTTYPNSVPSGWTLLPGRVSTGDTYSVYYRIASSEGSNYTWGFSGAVNISARILTYRGGFNTTNPINLDCLSSIPYSTSNNTVRAASVGVNKQYSPLIFIGIQTQAGETWTKPSVPTTDWVEDLESSSGPSYDSMEFCSMVWSSYGSTGDIDATFTGSATTNKHAFLIVLNPDISITWGASFSEVGADLPTYIYGPNPTSVDFQYNSATSKWETIGEDTNRILSDGRCGNTTHDMSSISTTIPHGLSKKPKVVRIKAKAVDTDTICWTETVYRSDSSTQASSYGYADTTSGTGEGIGNAFRLGFDGSTYTEGTIICNSTNIVILWTTTASPTGTASIMWEAEI